MPEYGAWTPTLIGAGGYVTGIHTTPADPNVVYLRNDASGTYRSDDRGGFWYRFTTVNRLVARASTRVMPIGWCSSSRTASTTPTA
jgi:hypothetical protein